MAHFQNNNQRLLQQNSSGNNNASGTSNNNNNSIFACGDTADTLSNVGTIGATPPPSRVTELHYGFASSKEILQHSVMPVSRQTKANDASYSVRDVRLGVCNRNDRCGTCGEKLEKCIGHIGHVPLTLPVFHPGLFQATLRVLRTICKNCSAVLLPDSYKAIYDKKIRGAQGDIYRLAAIVKDIVTETLKVRICYRCSSVNGVIRHVRPYRVVHFKYEGTSGPGVSIRSRDDEVSADSAETLYRTTFSTANLLNDGVTNTRSQIVEFLDPVKIRALLANVSSSDHVFFGMQPGVSLEDLVMVNLPITPISTRPHGLALNGIDIRDDDITRLYLDVINTNEALRNANTGTQGSAAASVVHWWNDLQFRLVRLMDAGMPGYLPSQRAQQPIKSFAQRLKGKHGRFRGNLSGKRVDFSGRSVISPDPNLEIDEVAIPLRVAKSLTYPQKVFQHNLALMKKFVQNGPDTHPGALTVILKEDGSRKDLRYQFDRAAIAQRLQPGDIVERHCINGDFIIFNRQPSLHRLSMMTHRARVLPHRTLRFNECCCAPYNADFDGDEMNIHLVQTEDARAEAHTLMSTVRNFISAKNGEPIIACIQDFLTGAFLLTSMDTFLDRSQISNICTYSASAYGEEDFDLPPPTILKPRELWTGKQVFDVIIQPRLDRNKKNSVTPVRQIEMNLEAPGIQYTKGARSDCKNEAWVTFHRSHLVTGRLDKKLLGGGAKDGLFAQLNVVAGQEVAARVMGRIARTTSRWLQLRGFSLGLGDVAITQHVQERKLKVVSEAFAECQKLIDDSNEGRLQPAPGLTVGETLEAQLNGVLSKVRETCGNEAVKVLSRANAPLVMAQSGSKGSVLNIAQMMAVVGQQTVGGKRIKHSFFNRTLPHVPRFAEDPAARGFVASSFFSSLKPTEFFFHTMAGREGLVDTAVKTADTGYIQRRVMKACEDLSVQYDWTVRTAKKNIVQFRFGEDSLDPLVMEGSNNSPVNFAAMWKNLVNAESNLFDVIFNESPIAASVYTAEATAQLAALMTGAGSNNSKEEQAALQTDAAVNNNTSKSTSTNKGGKKNQQQQQQQQLISPSIKNTLGANPDDLDKMATALIALHEQKSSFTPKFAKDLTTFVNGLIDRYRSARTRLDVAASSNEDDASASVTSGKSGAKTKSAMTRSNSNTTVAPLSTEEQQIARLNSLVNLVPCSATLLREFLSRCARKYLSKRCEPGSPCGALAAQSLCEPATQMTLRTFHFAGVASMSVTMGVPRLKEIINASKTIKTPIVTAPLMMQERVSANVAKASVERLILRDVTTEVSQVIAPGRVFLRFTLDRDLIKNLQIHLNSQTVRTKILEFARRPMSPLRELHERHFELEDDDHFLIRPYREESNEIFFILQNLRATLLDIHIHGIDSARRVIVSKNEDKEQPQKFNLLAETSEFLRVMTLPFVDGLRTTCNHVDSVANTLGIEAARTLIVKEVKAVLSAYSMSVDVRHIQLIADVMTHRGVVLGIQNYGITKMNSGVLTMASFERTTDHLYNACVFQRSDRSLSVSESIIVGAPIPLGTNSFGLLLNTGTNAVQNAQHMTRQQKIVHQQHQQQTVSSTTTSSSSTKEEREENAKILAKGIVAGPVATFAPLPTSIEHTTTTSALPSTKNTNTAKNVTISGANNNNNNTTNNNNNTNNLPTPRHSANSSSTLQHMASNLKVSFQSIFERSPLTAGVPQPMMTSGRSNGGATTTMATNASGKKKSARLYSMERARSGSFALDLSSAHS